MQDAHGVREATRAGGSVLVFPEAHVPKEVLPEELSDKKVGLATPVE